MNTSKTHPLWDANLAFLREALVVVDVLLDDDYARPLATCQNSSVGGHVRHCIEHYQALLDALEDGRVDYDARQRDSKIECDSQVAAQSLQEIFRQLQELAVSDLSLDHPLEVALTCGNECGTDRWQSTTLGRELQFQASHMVHHFALVRVMCSELGHELSPSFGVASATLKHRGETRSE